MARNRHKSSSKKKERKTSGAAKPVAERAPASEEPAAGSSSKRAVWIAAGVAAAIVLLAGLLYAIYGSPATPPQADNPVQALSFVGSDTCASCHSGEAKLWHASQHAHAMAHATKDTVLGDFNDARFDYFGVRSRFFRDGDKFMVETDGPDGKLATFEVKYTFGLDPLQQYLVEFPDGRIQALSLAWDSRPKSQGGQRWFHLYPHEEIRHDDILHWTKLNQNWNFMCAECHSTGVRKNYDAAKDRFATSWAEISVGCEACHGQGSAHVAWAKDRAELVAVQGRRPGQRPARALRRTDRRDLGPRCQDRQLRCGALRLRGCARRSRPAVSAMRGAASIAEDWVPGRPLSDTHLVAAFAQGLYQPDGQMLDEVYNYGSFKQSKMYAAGVTCSDCHDPHSAKLKLAGDKVCLQCHTEAYASPAHNHHEGVTPAVGCVSCHMPERTFMVVDKRHDHSFRVPRPDLSDKLQTSNACTDCHKDKPASWAAAAIEGWFGPERKGLQTYGEAFHAAWNDAPGAAALLAAVAADANAPSFARAGALAGLASHLSPRTLPAWRGRVLPIPTPWCASARSICSTACRRISSGRWSRRPLRSDPRRAAPRSLAACRRADRSAVGGRARNVRPRRRRVRRGAGLNADRPEARAALGNFHARRGETAEAEAEFQAALRLSPPTGRQPPISPTSTASLDATLTRRACCARRSQPRRRTQGSIMRSASRSCG